MGWARLRGSLKRWSEEKTTKNDVDMVVVVCAGGRWLQSLEAANVTNVSVDGLCLILPG